MTTPMKTGAAACAAFRDALRDPIVVERFVSDDADPRFEQPLGIVEARRHDDEARGGVVPTAGRDDRVTVHVRHLEIGYDGVEGIPREGVDGVGTSRERSNVVPIVA